MPPRERGAKPAEPDAARGGFESLPTDVAAFIALERLCCSFLTFRIEVPAGGGDIALVVSGPDRAAEVVEAEMLGRA